MTPSIAVALAACAFANIAASEPVPADCAAPTDERAPDPRCGEALDGRAPAEASTARMFARGVLWPPRLVSRAVFWPIVETSDAVEAHFVPEWIEAILTTDDGRVGVRPVVQYTTGFLPTGGLRFFYKRLPGQGSEMSGRFLTAGPAVYLGELDLAAPSWMGLRLRAVWNRRDDRLFAGIGANSAADLSAQGHGIARFGSDILLSELRWSRSLPHGLAAGLHADLQRRGYWADNVRSGPSIASIFGLPTAACGVGVAPTNACVDPSLVPGFQQGLRMAHEGAVATWNLRRHERAASGVSVLLDGTLGQGLSGDPTRDATATGEVVLALGGTDRVLLVRGRAAAVARLGSAPIPFEELISPAGAAGMRGFPEGRFRGASGIIGTAEYRWYISHDLDAALFSDVGTVAGPGFAGLGHDQWFPSFGVGLRHFQIPGPYWEGDLDTGVQLAYSPDGGFRVLLSVATF